MAAPKLEKGKQNGMDQPAITKSANEENNESYNHQLAVRSTRQSRKVAKQWVTHLAFDLVETSTDRHFAMDKDSLSYVRVDKEKKLQSLFLTFIYNRESSENK